MKLSDTEINELNTWIKKSKLDLPIHKREVTRYNSNYIWLQKNILTKNAHKVTPYIAKLLELELPGN